MNIYDFPSGRRLRFTEDACADLDKHRASSESEAGGILLGRVYPSEIVVEVATQPSSADRRGRFFFNRSQKVAQSLVNKAWSASDGEQIYLGEWHSHPEEAAKPSPRDRNMIANNFRETIMEIDFLVLVVTGRRRDWVGVQREDGLMKLKLLS